MAHLAEWDAGNALGDDMRDRILASSALAMITVSGETLLDYARGGSAAEAVWTSASEKASRPAVVSGVLACAHRGRPR